MIILNKNQFIFISFSFTFKIYGADRERSVHWIYLRTSRFVNNKQINVLFDLFVQHLLNFIHPYRHVLTWASVHICSMFNSTQFAIQHNSNIFPVDKRNCFDWFCLVENMKSFFQVHWDCLCPWPCGKWNSTWFRCHLFYWTLNSLWIIYFLFSVYFIFTTL